MEENEVIIISDSDHDSQPPSPVKKLKQELCGVDNTLTGLKCLNGTRIRSCYGCRNPIRKDLSYIPSPPHDIIISYKERRYYRDLTTQEMRLTKYLLSLNAFTKNTHHFRDQCSMFLKLSYHSCSKFITCTSRSSLV